MASSGSRARRTRKKPASSSLLCRRVVTTTSTAENRTTGITGKRPPRTLKPLRARQLIRRFHVLLKNRASSLSALGKCLKWDTQEDTDGDAAEERFQKWIKGSGNKDVYDKAWKETWDTLQVNKTPSDDAASTKIDGNASLQEIVRILGRIDAEIKKRGGLETYQTASTLGQDGKRGGDSSKVLVKWLREIGEEEVSGGRALEIGCLSSKNDISTCRIFGDIVRIDLHSQEPGVIEEQDFLQRPLPKADFEKFDVISCSLVVNFVPKPELRGDMLRRMCEFLCEDGLLFFVIPLPCVENSRYCDVSTLEMVFKKLGFVRVRYHASHKLAYWLWRWKGQSFVEEEFTLKKTELRSGKERNNFAIVMR